MSSHPYDVVFRGRRIMTTGGEVPREVGIRNGTIVAIEPYGRSCSDNRSSNSPTMKFSYPAWSTRTFTSMTQGALIGRASPPPHVPQPPAVSPRSSTCR